MSETRPVRIITEGKLPASEIADRYRAKEHEVQRYGKGIHGFDTTSRKAAIARNKKRISSMYKEEQKMPDDLVGPRQTMREAILQMSLFPSIYRK